MSAKSQPFSTSIGEISRGENRKAGNIFPLFCPRAQCVGKGWEEGRYFQTASQEAQCPRSPGDTSVARSTEGHEHQNRTNMAWFPADLLDFPF